MGGTHTDYETFEILMPIDSDGDFLRPEYRQNQAYNIGKASEHTTDRTLKSQVFQSYFEDILHLYQMPFPYWRRPNEKDNYGVVTNKKGWALQTIRMPKSRIAGIDRDLIPEVLTRSNELKKEHLSR